MRSGNWIPLSKALLPSLPKDRPYSQIEAAYSLQVDYDSGNPVTISGYSYLWRWSRKKVKNFLIKMGIEIIYPENTSKKQNQRGQISIQIRDRKGTDKGQIRLIDSKDIQDFGNRKGTDKGQIRDRPGTSTKDPNPNPDTNLCPHQEIVELYHQILPELPGVKVWSEARRQQLFARWNSGITNEDGSPINSTDYWKGFFSHIRESEFLMGQSNGKPGQSPFRPDLEWMIKKANFIRIIEGKYH